MEDLVQRLGPDFEKANVLSVSEVAHLMRKIKEEEPESRVFHQAQFEKTVAYVERFNAFKDFDVTYQVRKLLESYEFPGEQRLDNLEIALLSNLCPEGAEQAKALVPSLTRLGADELLGKACAELRKLRSSL